MKKTSAGLQQTEQALRASSALVASLSITALILMLAVSVGFFANGIIVLKNDNRGDYSGC